MGYLLMLVAVSIASVAAYFSVYGLAHIFAATFWSVVIMGGVLEVGKLVATSFLYRYWDNLKITLRLYLFAAIFGLMVLTSAGIFGYLSNAYQQDIVGVKDVAARIELLDTELASLTDRDKQINEDIGRIGSNYVTARQNMAKQYAPEKNDIIKRVAAIRAEKLELSTKQLEVEAHTGPIIYIAKALDKGVDEAVVWMICLIIFVFDPLAVALTIGANVALTANKPNPQSQSSPPTEHKAHSSVLEMEEGIIRRKETKASANAVATLSLQEPVVQAPSVQPQHLVPAGMSLVETNVYDTLRATMISTADEMLSLETDLNNKQDMIETLSTDNQRLEDELFDLADAFRRKEATITQLKGAIGALEQERRPLSIQERAAQHTKNQVSAKTL